ncbi:cysteine proteinase [Artomyces pyxidatus]|uniref:Cysteine proteinase n=1 Tax=Artomyces pyxidatus TaxID=48021 RepID=A0ACB8T5K6_9AGAM|nr:cysteine proteinase [Artomyces pyxidatus]
MNGHSPVPPSSPRVNGPGRGSYRGGPGPSYHQNYHPHPPHPSQHAPYMHAPPHVPMHSPQPSPTSPYPHHPQKYAPPPHPQSVPYSPPYVPPQQPTGQYPQNWSVHQPISPLPKQLSMPPPPPLSPLTAPQPPARILDGPLDVEPNEIAPPTSPPPTPPQEPPLEAEDSSPPSHELPHPARPTSSRPTSPSSSHTTSMSASASTSATGPNISSLHLSGGWAIWSRRPTDPTHAPGVIISPRACPPHDVVERALLAPTPPHSPKPVVPSATEDLPVAEDASSSQVDLTDSPPSDLPDAVSSSETETSTAPDTPVPGSPLSTNTSLSLAAPPNAKSRKSRSPTSPRTEAPTTATEVLAADQKATSAAVAEPKPELDAAPAADVATSTVVSPAPSAPKKSWASLLRPASGAASSSKSANTLPTSSVVGFSVPASPPPARVPPPRRAELLKLLTNFPPTPSPSLKPATLPAPRIRPRGLVNLGNMCFANSVLQLLVYCTPFWRLFGELGRSLSLQAGKEKEARDSAEGATPLVDATVRFLQEFIFEDKKAPNGTANGNARAKAREVDQEEEEDGVDSFVPTYIYDVIKENPRFDSMKGGHQEDAEEFFGFYLDVLEEELLSLLSTLNPSKPAPVKAVEEREEETPHEDGWLEVGKRNKMVLTRTVKSTESPITRIFGGKFRSSLRVPHQRDSVVIEDWRALQLDIQRDSVKSIQDALASISQPQSVQVTSPTRPGTTVEASQQIFIEALPPVLVLHLKRFLYDTSAKGVVKIGKAVAYSPELEIPQDIMAPGKRSARAERYQLYGVLYHHGLSASGGHYTLDVLHPNRDASTGVSKPREAWIRIDDEFVSDVRPEDVFNALDRDDRCAYLLFYRRVGGWART